MRADNASPAFFSGAVAVLEQSPVQSLRQIPRGRCEAIIDPNELSIYPDAPVTIAVVVMAPCCIGLFCSFPNIQGNPSASPNYLNPLPSQASFQCRASAFADCQQEEWAYWDVLSANRDRMPRLECEDFITNHPSAFPWDPFIPGMMPRRSTNASASLSMYRAIWPKSPAIHVARIACFSRSKLELIA